jgi:hypothetical protein
MQLTTAELAALNAGQPVSLLPPAAAPPTPVTSPKGTAVPAKASSIIDLKLNAWAINAAKVLTVNGIADTTTANVVGLYWDGAKVWQTNQAGGWWSKPGDGTYATAPWTAGSNPTVPLPAA